MKQLRESIMSDVNVNTDIKESKSISKSNILWLAYQQSKIFEEFKTNYKFVNVVNQFIVIKLMMVIKISILRFLN